MLTWNRPGEKWTHEQGSEMMLDFLIQDNNIEIGESNLAFVKALILGDPSKCSAYVDHTYMCLDLSDQ